MISPALDQPPWQRDVPLRLHRRAAAGASSGSREVMPLGVLAPAHRKRCNWLPWREVAQQVLLHLVPRQDWSSARLPPQPLRVGHGVSYVEFHPARQGLGEHERGCGF